MHAVPDDGRVQRCADCNRPLGRVSDPSEGLVYVCSGCEKKTPIECRYCGEPTLPDLEGTARCTDCEVEVRFARKRLVWRGEPEQTKVHWDNWGSFRYRLRRRFTEIERSLRHAAATTTVLDVEWDRFLPFGWSELKRFAFTQVATIVGLVALDVHPVIIMMAMFGVAGAWIGVEYLGRWLASKRWPATKVRVDAETIDVERGRRRRLFVRVDTEVSVREGRVEITDGDGTLTLPADSRAAAEWLAERIAAVPVSREAKADPPDRV